MKPIELLAVFLNIHYPSLTIYDVQLSPKPGYLLVKETKEPINIQGFGYGRRDAQGNYISINQLWMDLHDYFNTHIEVKKVRPSGLVTVIDWEGAAFTFDKNYRK